MFHEYSNCLSDVWWTHVMGHWYVYRCAGRVWLALWRALGMIGEPTWLQPLINKTFALMCLNNKLWIGHFYFSWNTCFTIIIVGCFSWSSYVCNPWKTVSWPPERKKTSVSKNVSGCKAVNSVCHRIPSITDPISFHCQYKHLKEISKITLSHAVYTAVWFAECYALDL